MNILNKWAKLEISTKTDILALTAFILSVTGMLYQFSIFLRGDDIRFFTPQKITIIAEKLPNFVGDEFIKITADMSYVNQGRAGYNGIVIKERVTIMFDDENISYQWLNFETYTLVDSKLKNHFFNDANPFVVNGGSGVSHVTSFVPKGVDDNDTTNYISWGEFTEVILDEIDRINFTFATDIYDHSAEYASCYIQLNDHLKESLKKNKWMAAECRVDPKAKTGLFKFLH